MVTPDCRFGTWTVARIGAASTARRSAAVVTIIALPVLLARPEVVPAPPGSVVFVSALITTWGRVLRARTATRLPRRSVSALVALALLDITVAARELTRLTIRRPVPVVWPAVLPLARLAARPLILWLILRSSARRHRAADYWVCGPRQPPAIVGPDLRVPATAFRAELRQRLGTRPDAMNCRFLLHARLRLAVLGEPHRVVAKQALARGLMPDLRLRRRHLSLRRHLRLG